MKNVAAFQREGSGWAIEGVLKLDVNLATYQPIRANTYIPLPKNL